MHAKDSTGGRRRGSSSSIEAQGWKSPLVWQRQCGRTRPGGQTAAACNARPDLAWHPRSRGGSSALSGTGLKLGRSAWSRQSTAHPTLAQKRCSALTAGGFNRSAGRLIGGGTSWRCCLRIRCRPACEIRANSKGKSQPCLPALPASLRLGCPRGRIAQPSSLSGVFVRVACCRARGAGRGSGKTQSQSRTRGA